MQNNNLEILKTRQIMFDKKQGARVGDFLKLRDGRYLRFSHNWGDDIQTCSGGSFYFGNGYCEFSGALHSAVDKIDIKQTDEIKKGCVWFFNNNEARAHNGVYVEADFRVFEFPNEMAEMSYIEKAHLKIKNVA